jgi:hypothetical protein
VDGLLSSVHFIKPRTVPAEAPNSIEEQMPDDSGNVQVFPSIPKWAKRVAEAKARVDGGKYTDVLRDWIVTMAKKAHPSAVPAVSVNGANGQG